MAGLYLETKLRPCIVPWFRRTTRKGLFHCWGTRSVGANSITVGIVELEDGHIISCSPTDIHFVDSNFDDYIWPIEEDETAK